MTDVETPTKGIGATDKDIRYSGNLYNENRKVKIEEEIENTENSILHYKESIEKCKKYIKEKQKALKDLKNELS
jgi:hypothetical protein